jgi:hypothetical protein
MDFMQTLETDHFKKMMEPEISYLIFCMEIARLWVEELPKEQRPILNISDTKLKKSYREYTLDMIKLKHHDEKKYKETKELIEESKIVARKFFEYMKTNTEGNDLWK